MVQSIEFERRWLLNLDTVIDLNCNTQELAIKIKNLLQKELVSDCLDGLTERVKTYYLDRFTRIKVSNDDYIKTTKLTKDRYESSETSLDIGYTGFKNEILKSPYKVLRFTRYKFNPGFNKYHVKEICIDFLDSGFVILEMEFYNRIGCINYKLPTWFKLNASELIGGGAKYMFARF